MALPPDDLGIPQGIGSGTGASTAPPPALPTSAPAPAPVTTLNLNDRLPAEGTPAKEAAYAVQQEVWKAQDALDAYLAKHPDVYQVGDKFVKKVSGGKKWDDTPLPDTEVLDTEAMGLQRTLDSTERLSKRVGDMTKAGLYGGSGSGAGGGAVEAWMTSNKNPDLQAFNQYMERSTDLMGLRDRERDFDISGQSANIDMATATSKGLIAPGFDSYFGQMPASMRHSNELEGYVRDPGGMYSNLFGEEDYTVPGYAEGTDSMASHDGIDPVFRPMLGKPSVPMDRPTMMGIPWPGSYTGVAQPGVR